MTVRPRLVLVGGRPAAGKTTLARRLADEGALWLPLLSADAVRTGMGDALDSWDSPSTAEAPSGAVVFDVFYRTIEALLRAGVSVIAEASYRRGLDETRLHPLVSIARAAHLHCTAPIEVARARFLTREPTRRRRSSRGEIPAQMEAGQFDWSPFEPMDLGVPRLVVDTQDGYRPRLAEITEFCRTMGGAN